MRQLGRVSRVIDSTPWQEDAVVIAHGGAVTIDREIVFEGTLLQAIGWIARGGRRVEALSIHLPERRHRPFSYAGHEITALMEARMWGMAPMAAGRA